MSDLKQLAAIAALNKMMSGGYVSISTIRTIAEMLSINPKGEAFSILETLHCVNFDKMPAELRDAVPGLIKQILNIEATYQFKTLENPSVVVVVEPEKPRGLLRLLHL